MKSGWSDKLKAPIPDIIEAVQDRKKKHRIDRRQILRNITLTQGTYIFSSLTSLIREELILNLYS